jgi:hypothetical protein
MGQWRQKSGSAEQGEQHFFCYVRGAAMQKGVQKSEQTGLPHK